MEERRLKRGLGDEKYSLYEKLARQEKFDEIPEHEMDKDYIHDTLGRLGGCNYTDNLLFPRSFFRKKYDSSYMFFIGDAGKKEKKEKC